jgi:hypothetical protein
MSKTALLSTKVSSQPFVIVKIITSHTSTRDSLANPSSDSLDPAMIHSSYVNAINLTRILHSSESLTDQFVALVTGTEDLGLKHDATVTNHNKLILYPS